MELRADRHYLTSSAYADDRLLQDRRSLYAYQQPPIDLVAETTDRLGALDGRRVVDLGCGNGAYHPGLADAGAEVVAVDLSAGMLRCLSRRPLGALVADGQAIPLAAGCADAVLAMHMLYHVPEPDRAVRESARILRPTGTLVAAVVGARHLAEARQLWTALVGEAGLDLDQRDLGLMNVRLPVERLTPILERSFTDVTLTMLGSQVLLDEPGPLLRYVASTTAAAVAAAQGVDLVSRLDRAARERIRVEGLLRITTEVALFEAKGPTPAEAGRPRHG